MCGSEDGLYVRGKLRMRWMCEYGLDVWGWFVYICVRIIGMCVSGDGVYVRGKLRMGWICEDGCDVW